jgi:hypothetical protein
MVCNITGWSAGHEFPLTASDLESEACVVHDATFRLCLIFLFFFFVPSPSFSFLLPSVPLPPYFYFPFPFASHTWASMVLLNLSGFVHAAKKLPWNVADVKMLIKRGFPHVLPLWAMAQYLLGMVSCAVKTNRLSRLSDSDAVVEIAFFAPAFAIVVGPW